MLPGRCPAGAPAAALAALPPPLPSGQRPCRSRRVRAWPASMPVKALTRCSFTDPKLVTPDFMRAKQILTETLLEQINFEALEKISRDSRKGRISETVDTLIAGINVPLTAARRRNC